MTEIEYSELYTKEWGKAVNYALQILGKWAREDAEEVVQDTFVDMLKRKDKISKPIQYLYNAVRHEACKVKELSRTTDILSDNELLEIYMMRRACL